MKKLFKSFIIAILALCSVACDQLGGSLNGDDDNLEISVSSITSNGATIRVLTSSTNTYYCNVVEKSLFDNYSNTIEFATEIVTKLQQQGENLSETLLSGNSSIKINTLAPNTEYYAYAFYISPDGLITSDITIESFKTLEAPSSDNDNGDDNGENNGNNGDSSQTTFTIEVSNITATGATVSVTPSNSDTYFFDVIEKSVYDQYTDKMEFASAIVAFYGEEGMTPSQMVSTGNDDYVYEDWFEANTQYYAFAFGLDINGNITTGITTKAFATPASSGGSTGGDTGGSTGGDKNITYFNTGYYVNYGDCYGTNATNWFIEIYSNSTNDSLVLELQGNLSETAPVAGDYQILSSFAVGTAVAGGVDNDYLYGTYWALLDDNWQDLVDYTLCTSGTIKVGKSGNNYTFDVNAVSDSGNSIKVSFDGALEEYSLDEQSISAQKLSNSLNRRFCTVSRLMKQKQVKMAPKVAKKDVVAPKNTLVKRHFRK